jgi:hypothetical protein
VVFGCRAGRHAGAHAAGVRAGKLHLEHVTAYHRQLEENGVLTAGRVAPLLLPRYTHRSQY